MVNKILLGALLVCLTNNVLPGYCLSAEGGPTDQIRSFVESVIGILQDDTFSEVGKNDLRRVEILKQVDKRFNFNLMAKLSLGQVWKRISEQQQDHFAQLFGDLLKNTYINRIEGYSNEKVIYGDELIKKDLAQVSSVFEKNNTRMSIIYKLRKENDNQWLVYDVVIEGASVVKQYRRQFAQIIDHEDFGGLILRLEDKMKVINSSNS